MQIVIRGRIPSKKNSRITTRTGRSFPSKKYTEWHTDAEWQVKTQNVLPIKTDSLVLTFYFPDHRRADLTNKAESVMDLLVDCKIIEDDSWQTIRSVLLQSEGVDKENPRCEINW